MQLTFQQYIVMDAQQNGLAALSLGPTAHDFRCPTAKCQTE